MVQIPLWTIVTSLRLPGADRLSGSDSSMDDCNIPNFNCWSRLRLVQIPLWTIVTAVNRAVRILDDGSDSSMDDCNLQGIGARYASDPRVQIPLWTIVTHHAGSL